MANLNALIAQGAQFNLPDPVDQYSKVMQLQQMGQANQLNRLKMDEYTRGVTEQTAMRNVISRPGFDVFKPEDQALLLQAAPSTAPGFLEKLAQVKKEQAQTGLYGAQGSQINYELQVKKLNQGLIEISNMPSAAAAKASVDANIANGSITAEKGAQLKASIDATPDFLKWKTQTLTGMLAAKDRLDAMDEESRIASRASTAAPAATPMVAPAATAPTSIETIAPDLRISSAVIAEAINNPNSTAARMLSKMKEQPGLYKLDVAPNSYYDLAPDGQVVAKRMADNQLAPPVANVNAMNPNAATMQAINVERTRLEADRNRLLNLRQSKGVQDELKGVEARLKELNAPINLRADGTSIIPGMGTLAASRAQSELARLMSERAALVASGAALTDNRVIAYDNAITKASAPSAGQPSDVSRFIAERNAAVARNAPPDEIAALNAAIKKATTSTPPISVENKINTYMPASEEAQRDFIRSTRATYDTLKNAPGTLKNIEEAIKLIPNAKGFMGPGGESLLDAASFLNNRLGTNINTKGVTNATELRSRLFQGIIENLRKLDANPTENQQNAMRVALGNIGTDPNALPAVLNSFADTVRSKVDMYNAEVEGAVSRGVKFPYDPTIKLPTFTPPEPPKAAASPAGVPAEWTLQVDKAGKKAYVNPDGKSFQEVP